jgi:hypothetical protein
MAAVAASGSLGAGRERVMSCRCKIKWILIVSRLAPIELEPVLPFDLGIIAL